MHKLLIYLFFFLSVSVYGQRVANFSYGNYDAKDFESYSFWVKANKRAEIKYTYKTNTGEFQNLTLKYIGLGILNGEKGFKVRFPNNLELYIIPKESNLLKIAKLDGSYSKEFRWLYEGPVDGKGTFCEPCAENEQEALRIVKMYYSK